VNSENPFVFLIDTLFDLYIIVLMLRFLLQQVRADYYNPVSQFIVKATSPVVMPVRRIVPGFGGIDVATVLLIIAFICVKVVLVSALQGFGVSFAGLLLYSVHEFLTLAINVFMFAIIIQAILSWVNPDPYNPVYSLLSSITAPLLRPVQRMMPSMGGLDLSPMVVLIGLMFLKRLVIYLFQMM
jgi:YggT family protein